MGTRWSPLAVLVAVAVFLLGGAGVVALVAYEEDDDPPASEALQTLDETTTTITTEAPTTSTTTAVAGTSTSAPTTVRRTTTTRVTSTTVRTTTTARPTTTTPGRPLCAVEQIDISVGTDSVSYPAGRPVKMTTTIRNKSSSPCYFRGYNVGLTFLDPGGRTVLGQVVHADAFEDAVFAPGQRITHDGTWDQRICDPCVQAPPGIYSVSADWSFSGGRYGGTQQFILR